MAVDSTKSIAENYAKYAQFFTTESADLANTETFYELLLAEMTNQDPLEPTSNTEFISQLATFSSLQNQSNALAYQQSAYATSLTGKTVTVATSDGTGLKIDTGVVTAVDLSDGENIEITVNGKRYALNKVMAVNSTEQTKAEETVSVNGDGAYATSLIGKQVTVVENNVIDQGTVDYIEVQDGLFTVVVNGLAYDLSSVVRVANPSKSSAAEDEAADEIAAEKTRETDTSILEAQNEEIAAAPEDEEDIADLVDEEEQALLDLFS